MGAADALLRSLDPLEWIFAVSVLGSGVCVVALAAMFLVGNGRHRWNQYRHRRRPKAMQAATEPHTRER